jgi:hypothetical protein
MMVGHKEFGGWLCVGMLCLVGVILVGCILSSRRIGRRGGILSCGVGLWRMMSASMGGRRRSVRLIRMSAGVVLHPVRHLKRDNLHRRLSRRRQPDHMLRNHPMLRMHHQHMLARG